MIGQKVKVVIDRPLGSYHPKHHDIEEKWIIAPEGFVFTKEDIMKQVEFQEKYFQTEIRILGDR